MALALLRSSTLRGSAFRRVLSSAAAPTPSAGKGTAGRRAAPRRRFSNPGSLGEQHPKPSLDDKMNLLHQSIRELDSNLEKRYLLYASLQKLVEEKKMINPFVQWSWQVCAFGLTMLGGHWMGAAREDD